MAKLIDTRKEFLGNPYTIKNIRRDFHEWHQGRRYFGLWALDVDYPEVRQQVRCAERHLADLLLEGYFRQPHVTLGISGFLSHSPQRIDDYGAEAFEADVSILRNSGIKPFEIEIGTLGSFSSAPFLHVRDPANHLPELHALLHSQVNHEHVFYVPHVTVGLYAEAWLTETVSSRLAVFPLKHASRCMINRISLMAYQAAEIGGALVKVADYDLDSALVNWYAPSLLM